MRAAGVARDVAADLAELGGAGVGREAEAVLARESVDVAGYDLKSLLVGSEGTLGLVTAAWLRLVPAPELELPVIGLYRDAEAGISALERVLASGVVPSAVEYLDGVTLSYSGDAYPFGLPPRRRSW